MKTIRIPFIALLALALSVLLVNCSKEKRFERSLYKQDGTWNIDNLSWQKVVNGTSGQSVTLGSTASVGTFTFDKEGGGSYNFTVDGTTYSQTFSWTVSETSISITKVSQSVDFLSGDVDQLVIALSGSQNEKNSITLTGTETHNFTSGSIEQSVLTGTFLLSKK